MNPTSEAVSQSVTTVRGTVDRLPTSYFVDVLVPHRLYEQRIAIHRQNGSLDPVHDVMLYTTVQLAEQEIGRPVCYVDPTTLQSLQLQHEYQLSATVVPLPRPEGGCDIEEASTLLKALVTPERVIEIATNRRLTRLLEEARQTVDRLTDVGPDDTVLVRAWNTGLGRAPTVELTVPLAQHTELAQALIGKACGAVAVGQYPIHRGVQVVTAQKIELIGRVNPTRSLQDLAQQNGLSPEEFSQNVRKEIQTDTAALDEAIRSLAVEVLATQITYEPVPAGMLDQIAALGLEKEIAQQGAVVVLSRYGVFSKEDAVLLRYGTELTNVRAMIGAYWLLRVAHPELMPTEEQVHQYAISTQTANRVYARLALCLDRVIEQLLTPAIIPPTEETERE